MADRRTIFAMGGGGFTMETSSALDDFILGLAAAREPRICFLPTASGDPDAQIARFHGAFADKVCQPSFLSLFRLGGGQAPPVPLRELLLSQDIVYVGGGSMRNLLAIWRVHGLDEILHEAWEWGVVLAGLSAGAMCWFQWGVTKSTGVPEPVEGLGLLPGSLTVHADGEPERVPVHRASVGTGVMPGGWEADDGVGLLFRGTRLERAVSSRPDARAQRVERVADDVICTPLLPTYLPGAPARPSVRSRPTSRSSVPLATPGCATDPSGSRRAGAARRGHGARTGRSPARSRGPGDRS